MYVAVPFATDILRIGDYVTFKNVKHSTLLCAEGILLEDIIANDHVKVLDDCLFCIHLQRQYSAARELEEFMKSKKDDSVDDAHAAKYFQALKVWNALHRKNIACSDYFFFSHFRSAVLITRID